MIHFCTGRARRSRCTTARVYNHELMCDIENKAPPMYVVQGDMCHRCNLPMIILASEALLGCPRCSQTRLYIQATSSRIAYGEEVEFVNFSYKRQNHFFGVAVHVSGQGVDGGAGADHRCGHGALVRAQPHHGHGVDNPEENAGSTEGVETAQVLRPRGPDYVSDHGGVAAADDAVPSGAGQANV